MRRTAFLFIVCFVSACQPSQKIEQEQLALAPSLNLPTPSRVLLTKSETTQERRQTKSDQFDVRGEFENIFGESLPPRNAVRAIAEFENTEAVLIAWEQGLGTFLLDLIAATALVADVWVITWDLEETAMVRELLTIRNVSAERVRFFEFPHESFWTRDYGPISVVDELGVTSFVDPRYYPQRRRDDAVPTLMARYFGLEVARPAMSTEGGNFMTNGKGVCVVSSWLYEENPDLSASGLEAIQAQYFGCSSTIFLERLAREGTGHVDMYAKFLSQDTILVGEYDETDPQNAALLDRNVERLRSFAEANAWPLNIVRIPMPLGGNGVYRSYTNSLIVNDVVIVPTYRADTRYEAQALEIYRNALPAGYTVVGLDAEDAIQLGGAVHCTTMGFVTSILPPQEMPPKRMNNIEPMADVAEEDDTLVSTPNAVIKDDEVTSDVIQVNQVGSAFTVQLDLEISHSYLGDLVVELVHDDFRVTVLRNVGTGASELHRRFEIEFPRGVERSGLWQILIKDTAPEDEGVLRRWALTFTE